MRNLLALLVAVHGVVPVVGQEKLPPRFDAFAKNERFRLVRVLGTPEMPPIFHQASAFSADGKRAIYALDLSTGADDRPQLRTRLYLWDVQAKTWPREIDIDGKSLTALVLSADGSKALLAGQIYVGKGKPKKEQKEKDKDGDDEKNFRSFLSLWDLNTGKELKGFAAGEKLIQVVALASDEATALTGTADDLQRWDLKQGKAIATYGEKGKLAVTALAYLPGGKRFLAGARGGAIELWDVAGKKPLQTYASNGDKFAWHLAVSPDGKRFASGDAQTSVTLWETDTGKEINTFRIGKRPAEEFTVLAGLALADDGKTVLSVWGNFNHAADDFKCAQLIAWDGAADKKLWSHPVSYRGRVPVLVQKDKLLIGGGPNLFEIWNLKTGEMSLTWGGHKAAVHALAAIASGEVLSGGPEGVLITWRQGLQGGKHPVHAGPVHAMAVSGDRRQLLTASADQTVKLWNAADPELVHVFKGHTAAVTSVAFSKSGWACSGSADRTARTWDLKSGKELAVLAGHSEGVNAVAVSPDDKWLATGSDDGTVRVWPIAAGKLDADRESITLEGHKKPVTCLAFSADGKTLLSGSQDNTLKVWDWAKEKLTRSIPGHKNWVTSVMVIGRNTALTTSDDLSICLWELASGKELGRIDFGSVGDCPRCVSRLGADRLLVGTSDWLIYEFQIVPGAKSR
jgi:WD40 repeat protein